jgi:uncharacterized phage protein (TIGR02220 family)
MVGWIADFRKELESDVWRMPPMYHRVWQYLKYKVNHEEQNIPNRDGTFTTIKPGQHATSYRIIARDVGYYEGLKRREPNAKTIKVILDWLEKNSMITVKGNTQGTIITLVSWDKYQSKVVKGNTKETRKKHEVDTNNKEEQLLNNEKEVKDIIPFAEIIDYLNLKTEKNFKSSTQSHKNHIKARWKEGYRLVDFKKVIDIKSSEWLKDPKTSVWLRPETLFGTKFESYLNQKGGIQIENVRTNAEQW